MNHAVLLCLPASNVKAVALRQPINLAFGFGRSSVVSMDTPFFRRWFSRPEKPAGETIETRAGHGDAEAQFSLGLRFAGEGVTQDYAQAAQWYQKAADQSHSLAQFNLGIMYAAGQGVPCDEAKSMGWMQKAADQGDAGAQYHIGMKHHRVSLDELPEAASESRIQAYKWLQLAAAQGYRSSEAAWAFVALGMTREDVADGGRRIAAFVPAQANQPVAA
jgi:TPR repeat protein